jgi:hypothetical protein
MIDKNAQIHMISIDGGLRQIPQYMTNDLQKKGWRIVTNPKRTYYAEYDQTSPYYRPGDNAEDDNFALHVDVL